MYGIATRCRGRFCPVPALAFLALGLALASATSWASPLFDSPFYTLPIAAMDCRPTDVNGDGLDDIVAVYDSSLSVHLNRGSRRFELVFATSIPRGTHQIIPSTLNYDDAIDLVLSGAYGVRTMLGVGDGTYRSGRSFTNADARCACADFDGNGLTDIVVHEQELCRVFLSRGDDTFDATAEMRPGRGMCVADDFDVDGRMDLAALTGDESEKRLVLYTGNGAGTFSLPVTSWTLWEGEIRDIVSGEFTPDSLPDIAFLVQTGYGHCVVLTNRGDEGFEDGNTCTSETGPASPNVDLRHGSSTESALPGDELNHRPRGITCIESADLDGDGERELLTHSVYSRVSLTTHVARGAVDASTSSRARARCGLGTSTVTATRTFWV